MYKNEFKECNAIELSSGGSFRSCLKVLPSSSSSIVTVVVRRSGLDRLFANVPSKSVQAVDYMRETVERRRDGSTTPRKEEEEEE